MAEATTELDETDGGYGDLAMLRRVWPYVRLWRGWLVAALVLTPIGVGVGLLQPMLLKWGIDGWIAQGTLEGLPLVAGLFAVALTVGYAARALGAYALQLVGLRGLATMRRQIFDHVMGQSQRFFDRRTTGSLLTRTTNDVEAVYESMAFGVVNLFADGLLIVGILVAMLTMDWRLTLVVLAMGPVIAVIVDVFRRRLKTLSLEVRRALSRLNGFFAEQISGMTSLQLYGAEERARREFRREAYRYLDAYRRSNWWDAGLYAIMDAMKALAIGLMLWYGAVRFGTPGSGVTLGLLVAFVDYLGMLFGPVREFAGRIATIQRAVAALERIFGLLDVDDRIPDGPKRLDRAEGRVELDRVRFAYDADRERVLDDVSFRIEPGEVVALVGATGSGKTTVGRLLLRLYDGYEGAIRLDGHDLSELRLDDLREQIAIVHQDVHLFDATMAENIAMWDETISRDRVREAARLARAADFIEQLPHGYDERCTERGANLSVGQQQLLAIARALVRDAPIVVLDEATASVDPVTEARIDEAVAELLARRTVLVIAHRLSTVARADRVVMLDQGRVVDQGSHDELMARDGPYRQLVEVGLQA